MNNAVVATIPVGADPLFVALTPAPSSSVLSGLIAYYPLDGNANDISGNGYNLALSGNPPFVSGRFGEALSLDGTGNQYAARPVSDAAFDFSANDFTVQVWVNFNNHSSEQTLIEKWTGCCGPGWTLTAPPSAGGLQFAGPSAVNAT